MAAPSAARHRFSIGLLANIGGGLWSAVMAMAVLPVAAAWMGLAAFALVAFFQVLQMALQVFDFGFSALISRELGARRAHDPGVVHDVDERSFFLSLEAVYVATGLVLGLLVAGAVPVAATHWSATGLDAPTLRRSLFLIAALLAANWPVTFYYGALQGLGAQVPANGVQMGMVTIASLGGLAALAVVAPRPDVWLAWQLAVSAARAALLRGLVTRRLRRQHAPRRSWRVVRAHARFAAGVTLSTLPAVVLTHVDKLAVSWFGTPQTFSMYYLGATLGMALAVLIAPLYQSLLPKLSAAVVHGEADVRATFMDAARIAAALLGPPSIVLALLAPYALLAWTGDRALATAVAPVTMWLALGNLCNGLQHVPFALQLAWRWTRPAVYMHTAALVVTVPAVVLAAARGEMRLLALTLAAVYMAELVFSTVVVRRRLSFSLVRLLASAVLPATAAGVTGALAGLMPIVADTRGGATMRCLVSGAVATGAMILLNPWSRHVVRQVLRARLGAPV